MSIRGGIALQMLKSYLGLSDAKLIARINSNWVLQFLCGIRLKEGSWIKDRDYVGRWRRFLAKDINYDIFQKKLVWHWKPKMKNTNVVMMDATCYESYLHYPTDVKLLWESCEQLWKLIDGRCKILRFLKFATNKNRLTKLISTTRNINANPEL